MCHEIIRFHSVKQWEKHLFAVYNLAQFPLWKASNSFPSRSPSKACQKGSSLFKKRQNRKLSTGGRSLLLDSIICSWTVLFAPVRTNFGIIINFFFESPCSTDVFLHTDRQTDRQTDRHTDTQTHRHIKPPPDL